MKNSPPDSPPLSEDRHIGVLFRLCEFKRRYELKGDDAALFDTIPLCEDRDVPVPPFARSGLASHWRQRYEGRQSRKFKELFDIPDIPRFERNQSREVDYHGFTVSVRTAARLMMSKKKTTQVSFDEVGEELGVSGSLVSKWHYGKDSPFDESEDLGEIPVDFETLMAEVYPSG
jgi:hypothetical protein